MAASGGGPRVPPRLIPMPPEVAARSAAASPALAGHAGSKPLAPVRAKPAAGTVFPKHGDSKTLAPKLAGTRGHPLPSMGGSTVPTGGDGFGAVRDAAPRPAPQPVATPQPPPPTATGHAVVGEAAGSKYAVVPALSDVWEDEEDILSGSGSDSPGPSSFAPTVRLGPPSPASVPSSPEAAVGSDPAGAGAGAGDAVILAAGEAAPAPGASVVAGLPPDAATVTRASLESLADWKLLWPSPGHEFSRDGLTQVIREVNAAGIRAIASLQDLENLHIQRLERLKVLVAGAEQRTSQLDAHARFAPSVEIPGGGGAQTGSLGIQYTRNITEDAALKKEVEQLQAELNVVARDSAMISQYVARLTDALAEVQASTGASTLPPLPSGPGVVAARQVGGEPSEGTQLQRIAVRMRDLTTPAPGGVLDYWANKFEVGDRFVANKAKQVELRERKIRQLEVQVAAAAARLRPGVARG